MEPPARNRFGRSKLEVTAISFGTAPIGNFLRPISEEVAQAMVDAAWDAGLRYFDTAPMYGHGLSELRLGHALRWRRRDDYVLSTKVGRLLTPAKRETIEFAPWVDAGAFAARFDYSYDGAMRSLEDSLQRLGLERIDIVFIHDCDRFTHGERQPEMFEAAMNGAARAVLELREQGVIGAAGLGVNEWEVCHAALLRHDFDAFLLAGRYTLLEHAALDPFLALCQERNAGVVVGGGFNSGILATGAVPGAKYNYAPAPEEVVARVRRIEEVCAEFEVPLPAAALQFVLAHPAVPTFCVGTRTVAQLEQNLAWFRAPIPGEFWQELKRRGLLAEAAPTPG